MTKFMLTLCFAALLAATCCVSGKTMLEQSIKKIGHMIIKHDIDNNVMEDQLYSPYAIGNMAGMMLMGANDQLKHDLMKMLMLNKTDEINMLHNEFETIMKSLAGRNDIIKQRNVVGVQKGNQIKSDFEMKAKKHYPMVMEMNDFHKADFIQEGNMRLSERTGGKLSKIFLRDDMKIAADTNMLMMSLAFTTKLEPDNMKSMKMADKAKFHTIDHKEVDKDMIRIHGDMNAIVDDEKTLFIMKMKGNFSFIGFMPKMDFNKYMKEKFDFVKFREEVLKMYNAKKEMVDLKMPCLHIDKEYHLMDIFNMLGVKKDSLAKMNSWPMIGEQLKMGEESIHRTMLMIDVHNDQIPDTMEGVKEIEINRPFSFVIMDHTHHLPMFTGMIMM